MEKHIQKHDNDKIWYPCTISGCSKKYRTSQRLEIHINKDHTKIPSLYICTLSGCNRKLKKQAALETHLSKVHSMNIEEMILAEKARKEIVSLKIEEEKSYLETLRAENAKALETAKVSMLHEYRKLEEEKLRIEQLKLEESRYIELTKSAIEKDKIAVERFLLDEKIRIMNNLRERTTECCICMDKKADTTSHPCGHLICCYNCLDTYHTRDPEKGCPLCRQEIINYSKTYIV